ncbi:TonB-dependent receptor [Desulfosarcina variabilis str. Montpellier]|uniref:TonB-dependent receptor n=1 Tax=Desulfosarcina variabilis TaxID=2300 RepID=UPI003AFA917E
MKKGLDGVVQAGFTWVLLLLGIISWTAGAGVVLAEETDRQTGSRKAVELETITVTAQKQEENIQEVPVSVTVMSQTEIEDRNIESIGELSHYVPNFMINNEGASGMNAPVMRGIYANATTLTVSSGLFVDGVPVLSSTGYEDTVLDIERVEVLRGPQGTLYGKNTETGAINIITRQPDNDFRAKVSADVGKLLSFETGDGLKQSYTLNLSGPLKTDKLFMGIAGKFYQKDGFMENTLTGDTVDDRQHWFGRAHLRWTPADRVDVSLIASMLQYDDDAVNMSLTEFGAAAYGLSGFADRQVASNFQGSNQARTDTQALKINYDYSDTLTLTSITARRVFDDEMANDWDFSPMTLMHSDKDSTYTKISQELRVDSSSENLQWLAGFYYDNDRNEFSFASDSDFPAMASTTRRDFNGEAYAAFGQISYAPIKSLRIIGGLRYEIQDQEYENHILNTTIDDSWDEISPKLALEYNWTPSTMTYVSVSKGYRSGGFNTFASDPQYNSYDEEKLWSYEIGSKNLFWDNRLMINGCVFLMDLTDMQVTEAVTPMESYLTNAAEATGKGIELEMTANITSGLSMMAGVGYIDIEFDDFKDALGDYTGNKNPYAPEYTFNIGVQYRFQSGLYARADLIGCGEMYLDRANQYKRDAYELVNARIGYETEHLDVYLYGKNIFDEEYNSYGYYDGYYIIYSDPGEVGLQVTCRF